MHTPLTRLQLREIQACILSRAYSVLVEEYGREKALEIMAKTTRKDAMAEGAVLAANASGAPCLAHFAGIIKSWQAGDALDIPEVKLEENILEFQVDRCMYVECYRALGIPEELIYSLSCVRDGSLAKGYSPNLRLERPQTISQGAPSCIFRFIWE